MYFMIIAGSNYVLLYNIIIWSSVVYKSSHNRVTNYTHSIANTVMSRYVWQSANLAEHMLFQQLGIKMTNCSVGIFVQKLLYHISTHRQRRGWGYGAAAPPDFKSVT